MDKYGPLYHRNSRLLPGGLARTIITVVVLIGIALLVLGVTSVIH